MGSAPAYAIGASSGGTFVTLFLRTVPLVAAVVQISPGLNKAFESREDGLLPLPLGIGYLFMARDWQFGSDERITENVKLLRSISLSSGGDPLHRFRKWPVYPHALTAYTLSDRIPSVTRAMSTRLFEVGLKKGHLITPPPTTQSSQSQAAAPPAAVITTATTATTTTAPAPIDSRTGSPLPSVAVLAYDPRDLELMEEWKMTVREEFSQLARNEAAFDSTFSAIGEVLNVLWGEHELTSELWQEQILPWMLSLHHT